MSVERRARQTRMANLVEPRLGGGELDDNGVATGRRTSSAVGTPDAVAPRPRLLAELIN